MWTLNVWLENDLIDSSIKVELRLQDIWTDRVISIHPKDLLCEWVWGVCVGRGIKIRAPKFNLEN